MQFYELEQSPGGDAETCYRFSARRVRRCV